MKRTSPNVVYVGDILSVPRIALQYRVTSVHDDERGDHIVAVKIENKEDS